MKKRITMLLSAMLLVCLFALPVSAKSTTINGKAVSTVTPGNSTINVDYTYDSSSASYLGKNHSLSSYNDYGVVIPVKINSKGILNVQMANHWTNTSEETTAEVYKDAACTQEYKYSGTESNRTKLFSYTSEYSTTSNGNVYISASGTYYIKIYSDVYEGHSAFSNSGRCSLRFVSSADRTLSANKPVTSYGEKSGIYYKVNVDKSGYLNVNGRRTDGGSMYVRLCNSQKKAVSNAEGYLGKSTTYTSTYKVGKGTYYIYVYGSYDYDYSLKYTFATTINASNNKAITLTPANKGQTEYVKIKPSKTGYITLTSYDYASGDTSFGNVVLCNSKQKAMTDSVYMSSGSKYYGKAVFAVKKNETYYLKVNAGYPFRFKYAVSGVSEKSGSNAGKAVNIKKGNTVRGTILAGENRTDYYKFTLSKAQQVNLTVEGKASSGAVKVEIYSNKKCSSKYYVGSATIDDVSCKYKLTSKGYSTNGKLSKGTYYFKVVRKNAKSNGYYSIKWDK